MPKGSASRSSQPARRMVCDRRNALSSWRISLSHLTTEDEIKAFVQAFDVCYRELTAVH